MNFGFQPDSYRFVEVPGHICRTAELALWYCPRCGFVFIKNPMDSEGTYTDYQWPTSFSPPNHLDWLVGRINELCLEKSEGLIVEIGSNDGYLLKLLKGRNDWVVIGVEPSGHCAARAQQQGIQTLNAYFDQTMAKRIKRDIGVPQVVICRHVIEHMSNPDVFFSDLKHMTDSNSVVVIEVPSFEMTAEKGDFSTIWEQHISYFTLETLTLLAARHGYDVFDHAYLDHGGGSFVVFLKHEGQPQLPVSIISGSAAMTFRDKAEKNICDLKRLIHSLRNNNKTVAAYGAGSRGICLINLSGIARHIDYIVDDNRDKHGKYLPNTCLEIVRPDRLIKDRPDYCLILPMCRKDLEKDLMSRHASFVEAGGVFIELYAGSGGSMVDEGQFDAILKRKTDDGVP